VLFLSSLPQAPHVALKIGIVSVRISRNSFTFLCQNLHFSTVQMSFQIQRNRLSPFWSQDFLLGGGLLHTTQKPTLWHCSEDSCRLLLYLLRIAILPKFENEISCTIYGHLSRGLKPHKACWSLGSLKLLNVLGRFLLIDKLDFPGSWLLWSTHLLLIVFQKGQQPIEFGQSNL